MFEKFAVPYLRVSTDDKGQDPQRQLDVIRPWAEREGYGLLKPEEDIGTSGSKVPPLQRPKFVKACERAKAAGAEAILVEMPDRFSRQDPELAIWEKVEVRRVFGLEIFFACLPREFQITPMGRTMLTMQHAAAHMWVVDHTAKVNSGIARGKARGVKFGRKPKKLAQHEIELVMGLKARGIGFEKAAIEINKLRGTLEMTDKKKAREKGVSSGSLRRMAAEGIFDDEITKQGPPDEIAKKLPLVAARPEPVLAVGDEVVSSEEGSV